MTSHADPLAAFDHAVIAGDRTTFAARFAAPGPPPPR
jgi:hypothetical protein